MIFVSVGTQLPFPRLLSYCEIAREKPGIKSEWIAQTLAAYDGKMKSYSRLEPEDFINCVESCKLMISHAGIGNILAARKFHKPILVVPRMARLQEHRNDHQLSTVRELKKLDGIFVAESEQEFISQVQTIMNSEQENNFETRNHLSQFLLSYIRNWPT